MAHRIYVDEALKPVSYEEADEFNVLSCLEKDGGLKYSAIVALDFVGPAG